MKNVRTLVILPSATVMTSMPRATGAPIGPNAQASAPMSAATYRSPSSANTKSLGTSARRAAAFASTAARP
jgi:hypothetical protein